MDAKCFPESRPVIQLLLSRTGHRLCSRVVSCRAGKLAPSTEPRQTVGPLVPTGRVLTLVASCVQANSDLARFEEVAGRTAMIAFAVALFLEPVLPYGVFSSWASRTEYLFAALLLVVSSGALAARSKRGFGNLKIQTAVLSCMTAFTRLASSSMQKSVDLALDRVFEQVFGSHFVAANLVDLDDFI